MVFEELDAYQRDLKSLGKRYRSLPEDIAVVKQILAVMPDARPPFSFQITGVGEGNCVVKVKKVACKSLKGKGVQTGLRLVYAFFKETDRIVLLEVYHKSDKENEDQRRIKDFLEIENQPTFAG